MWCRWAPVRFRIQYNWALHWTSLSPAVLSLLLNRCIELFWSRQRGFRCAILKKLGRREQTTILQEDLVARFAIRDRFLSDDELRCYRVLSEAVAGGAIVCPKPRVLETLRVVNAHEHLEDALRVDRKHIDFLICSNTSGHPLCAIQIDWWNEERQEIRPREQILAQAFERANFPVMYVPSNQIPTVDQMRQELGKLVGWNSEGKWVRVDAAGDSAARPTASADSDIKNY